MAYYLTHPLQQAWQFILMQTGQDVQTLEDPHLAFVFIWVIILFLSHRKGRLRYPGLRLKRNTGRLRMLLLKQFGYTNYLWNSSAPSSTPLLSTVTTYQPSIWPLIPCSIAIPSTLRSTFTLFRKRLLWEKFVFYMFQRVPNLQIFLPKASILRPLLTYAPVSTLWRPMLTLRGVLEFVFVLD
jgi:hypothetical protein